LHSPSYSTKKTTKRTTKSKKHKLLNLSLIFLSLQWHKSTPSTYSLHPSLLLFKSKILLQNTLKRMRVMVWAVFK
jgi:hypothetical protein